MKPMSLPPICSDTTFVAAESALNCGGLVPAPVLCAAVMCVVLAPLQETSASEQPGVGGGDVGEVAARAQAAERGERLVRDQRARPRRNRRGRPSRRHAATPGARASDEQREGTTAADVRTGTTSSAITTGRAAYMRTRVVRSATGFYGVGHARPPRRAVRDRRAAADDRAEADPVRRPSASRRCRPTRKRHYGIDSYRLRDPKVIVEHYTVTATFQQTCGTRSRPTTPDAELKGVARDVRALRDRQGRDDLPARPALDHVPAHGRAQLHGDRDRARRVQRLAGARQRQADGRLAAAHALAALPLRRSGSRT